MAQGTAFHKVSSYLTPKQRDLFQSTGDAAERERLIETGRFKRYSSACLAIGQIFEDSSNAMVIVDKVGDIVLVNDNAETMFQYQRVELIGNNVSMLIPGRYAESHHHRVAEFMMNPCCRPMGVGRDLYGVRKDGSEIPLEISLSPMKFLDEVFTAAIIADITERKRAERMFRIAVEASPTAMILVDATMQIVLVNSKSEALFQFTRAEMVGRHLDMIIPERYRAYHASHTRFFMREPTTRAMGKGERTLYGLKKDGTEFAIAIGLNVINGNEKEEGMMVLASITDMTEKIEMENVIKSSQVALEASHLKSIFLANMTHEIRTPMSDIISTMDLLASTELSEEQRLYVDMLKDSSRTLMGILNNVIDFSKIEAGNTETEFVEFDLCDLVDKAQALFSGRAAGRNIAFHVSRPDTPIVVVSDEVKVRQVLLNILDNAIKFTGEGSITLQLDIVEPVHDTRPWLPLSSSPPTGSELNTVTVRFTVADTGIGMSQDAMSDLFNDFYQADQSTTRRYGGTGLGLAICKKLIQILGGTISVESEEGKGSTFMITLAFACTNTPSAVRDSVADRECGSKNSSGVQARQPEETWQRAAARLHILVVEDNDVNRSILQRVLQKLGHDVEIATDGIQAVAMLEEPVRYDIVFMDCQMPVMDGYEATKIIRAMPQRRTLPIIALTASAIKGDRERCLEVGMNEYLTKPIRMEKLKEMINNFVGVRPEQV
ncbi:Histidine kinase [Plasmodiophora brassicae]|uniref:Histidine kinase n=1 Tax=Plasmodiophora brassicae TaxID=37360 RepID=A0A0G4IPK3_PLABS|nr:hypothetical protein PBRA_005734 [Plasmodiophora brassicae]